MARNLRPGADWVPAVVVERLGPLSYLVETSDMLLWRRHVDLLRELQTRNRDSELLESHTPDWDAPEGDSQSPAQPVGVPPPVAPPAGPDPPPVEAPAVEAPVAPATPERVVPTNSPDPTSSPDPPASTPPPVFRKQYPMRARQCPDRLGW